MTRDLTVANSHSPRSVAVELETPQAELEAVRGAAQAAVRIDKIVRSFFHSIDGCA